MEGRICPHCGRFCFSAASQEEIWECPTCGKDVPKDSQKPAGAMKEQTK